MKPSEVMRGKMKVAGLRKCERRVGVKGVGGKVKGLDVRVKGVWGINACLVVRVTAILTPTTSTCKGN